MKRPLIRVISALLVLCSLPSYKANAENHTTHNLNAKNENHASAIMTNASSDSMEIIYNDDFWIADNTTAFCAENNPSEASYSFNDSEVCEALSDNVKVGSRFWELLFGKEETKTLIASGDVFGIKMKDKFPSIVDAPGVPALRCGDRIISINGTEVHSAAEVKSLIGGSGGESVTLRVMRGGSAMKFEVMPKLDGGEYRIGITLKDMTAGIGTITFIDPENGEFGGLGHGICDSESGVVIPMQSGSAMEVVLGGIHKGAVGTPGELSGIMTDRAIGKIACNTEVGVFGKLEEFTPDAYGKAYEIGRRGDVKTGEATIISTVKNGKKAEYKIEIYDIDQGSEGSKSFRIRVKDPALIAITGGIVRGMSGSPIIQNGKLVGAVTHVLVADPTEGYGIFIENMLAAASEQARPKAA